MCTGYNVINVNVIISNETTSTAYCSSVSCPGLQVETRNKGKSRLMKRTPVDYVNSDSFPYSLVYVYILNK